MSKIYYRVMLVEKILPPEGMSGPWHRYVIGEGGAKVEGKKAGSLLEVKSHAELTAELLNERMNNSAASSYGRRRVNVKK